MKTGTKLSRIIDRVKTFTFTSQAIISQLFVKAKAPKQKDFPAAKDIEKNLLCNYNSTLCKGSLASVQRGESSRKRKNIFEVEQPFQFFGTKKQLLIG